MAIRPEDEYGSRAVPASADYPHGSAQNETVEGANDGTPYEERWRNDVWGFLQALLQRGGVVPSGNPDTAQNSDYLEAMLAVTGSPLFVGSSDVSGDFGTGVAAAMKVYAVTNNRILTVNSSSHSLQLWEYDGSTWNTVGAAFALSAQNNDIAVLSETRIAVMRSASVGSVSDLTTYDFDGSNWSSTGNTLVLPTYGQSPAITALSASRVALITDSTEEIYAADFDGTDWTVSNSLVLSAAGAFKIDTLSPSRVAIQGDGLLFADFDGTDWTAGATLAVDNAASMTAMSPNDVVMWGPLYPGGRAYKLSGGVWAQSGPDSLNMGSGITAPNDYLTAALNGVDLVLSFSDGGSNTFLRIVRLTQALRQPYSVAGGAF